MSGDERRRTGGSPPAGEKQNQPFQLSFNASLKVDFQESRVASDGGVLVRELDERLSFGELIAQHLTGSRRGKNTQLPLADLFPQNRLKLGTSRFLRTWWSQSWRLRGPLDLLGMEAMRETAPIDTPEVYNRW